MKTFFQSLAAWALIIGIGGGFAVWYLPGKFAQNNARIELANYQLKKLANAIGPIVMFSLHAQQTCKGDKPETASLASEKAKATGGLRFLVAFDDETNKSVKEFLSWYDGFSNPCDPASFIEPFSKTFDKILAPSRKVAFGI